MTWHSKLKKLKLKVPTYYGSVPEEITAEFEIPEFGEPTVPVLVHESDGVRIILGTHDFDDSLKPDIQIERRPKGWAIFLHPSAGDPCGYVYFLDDGRSFLVPEIGKGAIEFLDTLEKPPDIDEVDGPVADVLVELAVDSTSENTSSSSQELKHCARCRQDSEYSGDWYGDLCPECADETDPQ